jgi:hypothetical protein
MFFNESKFRKILKEEARRSLHEIAPLAVAAVAAPVIAGYRGYQNTQTRSAGLGLKYQDAAAPDPRLEALETDVRLVLYGGSATSSFFNMTADAGMFLKDLYFGDGGDFGDMSEESKEKIVFYTYSAIKKNVLTADSFYNYVKQIFKADPGTADGGEPQKEASATTEGTDTYFDMLSLIQGQFASGAPAAVDPAVDPAAAGPAGPAGPAKDWPSYVAATPAGGAAVQAAWRAYAAATGINAGFGTFARWYQANAKGLNPAQTAQKLASLSRGRGGAAPAAAQAAAGSPNAAAPVVVTPADTTSHPAEVAAVKAAETQVAAAEADPNPLTKKQKIAAALAARQAARAALVAARQRLRAVKKENMFRSDSNRLNENDQFQLKNLKITWGK